MLTTIELSKSSLQHNIRFLRKSLNPKTRLFGVVKANAYGHGMQQIAKLAHPLLDGFCVANTDEALQLRKWIPKHKRILALSYVSSFDRKHLRSCLQRDIEIPIFSFSELARIQASRVPLSVHVKIDTGASRVGFLENQIVPLLRILQREKKLTIVGLFSHFANVEDRSSSFATTQLNTFQSIAAVFKKDFPRIQRHIDCSAAMIRFPRADVEIVRPGIHLYGLSGMSQPPKSLHPVLSLTTTIIQIKELAKRTSIGYNRTYVTTKKSRIAVLPVGYADGVPRLLSNTGSVLIHGLHAPIRGSVCMNLLMVDVTNIQAARVGDCATIIGKNKQAHISTYDIAREAKTICYEITTRLSPHLPRIIT